MAAFYPILVFAIRDTISSSFINASVARTVSIARIGRACGQLLPTVTLSPTGCPAAGASVVLQPLDA
jgi:hypothetical protein